MDERRIQAHLRTFDSIQLAYTFKEPLARFLTRYFKENRQMGSKDRRIASSLIYTFYRIGNTLTTLGSRERLGVALYICAVQRPFSAFLVPELDPSIDKSFEEKWQILEERYGIELDDIFPILQSISKAVDRHAFLRSHFTQPDVFIRIHNGYEKQVKTALEKHAIPYSALEPSVLSFDNGVQLNNIKEIEGQYEIQDYSSQETASLFRAEDGEKWWDACAGSGGKSILLKQLYPNVDLTVSDIRPSILRNLDERFERAQISSYRKKIVDLEKDVREILGTETFDGIILDAPCSGSGTWGRTPEMLRNFTEAQLQLYVKRQKQLATHVVAPLKTGKPLVYITCSVFEEENERMIQFIESQGFQVEAMRYFKGYEHRADTLFAARLVKV